MEQRERHKIRIEGTVQGIGFRPFVYREALNRGLAGHVYNDSSGVTIEAEGPKEALSTFSEAVKTAHPPFAQILSFTQEKIPLLNEQVFNIIKSRDSGEANTLVSADIAACSECLADISDPANRRYLYPFTNCTNCGPRYTIIEGVPYDRPFTAMKGFKMCPECEAEYIDPLDRRYHAQPNCCPACGPTLSLIDGKGIPVEIQSSKSKIQNASKTQNPNSEIMEIVVELLNNGNILAIKGLGGFHLACDATNEDAVLRLRERKMRDEKPFAVMMPDAETVRAHCELSGAEEKLLTLPQRPIVLLRKKNNEHRGSSIEDRSIANSVAPSNAYLGVMLPYTPLHHLLFNTDAYALTHSRTYALIMTSANISDEPICFKNDEAMERLKGIADYFLVHDRDIYIRTDDSIARVIDDKPMILRRARGYAPQPVVLTKSQDEHECHFCEGRNLDPRFRRDDTNHILAVGAELKNTVCLLKVNKAFISQHVGDLENTASYESFENTIQHLKNLFDVKPQIIAHDMHPEYFSTKWAKDRFKHWIPASAGMTTNTQTLKLLEVQHHHAHIAGCMAENQIEGPVIGIALDGTGYGTDGKIWGGELFVADYEDFERWAHLEYIPLPGGDAAIKNPWQMAVAYIKAAIPACQTAAEIKGRAPSLQAIPDRKIETVLSMIEKRVNSPLTSSCGRLFDAVAAILGLRQTVSYEGQAALELEMEANRAVITSTSEAIRLRHNANFCHSEGGKTEESPIFTRLNGGSFVSLRMTDNYDTASMTHGYKYSYKLYNSPCITISYISTIKAILDDILAGVDRSEIALKFHNTVASALAEAAMIVSRKRGIKDVALSGGCFQNVLLTERLKFLLESEGLTVYTHSLVPPNDGGISLGQAAIASRSTLCV